MDESQLIILAVGGGVLITVVIVVLVLRWSARARARRTEALTLVAGQVGGRVEAGTWLKEPGLRYTAGGVPAWLEFYSTGGKHPVLYTRLHLELAAPFKLKIYPEGLLSRLGKKLGLQDVQVGDPRFDDEFMVKASDELRAPMALTPDVREAIIQLRDLGKQKHIEVRLDKGELVVDKLTWLEEPHELRTYLALAERVLLGVRAAIG